MSHANDSAWSDQRSNTRSSLQMMTLNITSISPFSCHIKPAIRMPACRLCYQTGHFFPTFSISCFATNKKPSETDFGDMWWVKHKTLHNFILWRKQQKLVKLFFLEQNPNQRIFPAHVSVEPWPFLLAKHRILPRTRTGTVVVLYTSILLCLRRRRKINCHEKNEGQYCQQQQNR